MLADTVRELKEMGLTVVDEGATCIFPPGFTGRTGEPMPLIVEKSDGAYTYDTTDLAAIRYRTRVLKADQLLYVVGAPQRLHFELVFAAARMAGWLTDEIDVRHIAFGSVLGEDGKMLRTRAGGRSRWRRSCTRRSSARVPCWPSAACPKGPTRPRWRA